MSQRQYVVCKFRPTDKRGYTYHHDGEPVAVGDEVKVPNKHGGWSRVRVDSIADVAPTGYDTKAILGKVEPEPAANLLDVLDEHDINSPKEVGE